MPFGLKSYNVLNFGVRRIRGQVRSYLSTLVHDCVNTGCIFDNNNTIYR